MKRFENKIAVVTGGANGIGECMVNRLIDEGAQVAIFDIEEDTMQEKFGGNPKVLCITCDVAKKDDVTKAVDKTVSHFGHIDLLFANAGIVSRTSLLDATEEEWRHVIDVNLNGVFFVNQAVLKHMVEMEIKGAVVNTSSVAANIVSVNTGAYSASKGGVAQLTKYAALEMAPYGIRVNAFGPGTSMTRITEGTRFDPERNAKFLANIPMGRYGEPEEAAAAALFLASDDASYITGSILFEEGGFSLF